MLNIPNRLSEYNETQRKRAEYIERGEEKIRELFDALPKKKNKKTRVRVLMILPHPDDLRMKLLPGEYDKGILIRDLGQINYNFAIKQRWIKEIK